MPRKVPTATPDPQSAIASVGQLVKADRQKLQDLLPKLEGGLKVAVEENLAASRTHLHALHGLGQCVKDQADLLGMAQRRVQAVG